MRFRLAVISIALIVAFVPASAYAAPHDWQRVEHLKPGQSITIQTVDSRTLSGAFVSVDKVSVTVRAHDVETEIPRDAVLEIRAEMTSRKKGGVLMMIVGCVLTMPNAFETGPLGLSPIGLALTVAGAVRLHRSEPSGVIYRRVPLKPTAQ